MPTTYRDLLDQTKNAIREVDVREARALIERDKVTVLDVREQDEVEQGIVSGAVHIPRGYLEMRVEETLRDRDRPIVV